jgi:hypothetical protein
MTTKLLSKEARFNDRFRELGFGITLTQGVHALKNIEGLLHAVRNYDKFDEKNDPYGEHDFGSLNWYGKKIFWKIDYYNPAFSGWCDPLSENCKRVLTVMLAEEY